MIVAGSVFCLLVVVYTWRWLGEPSTPSAEVLAERALQGAQTGDRTTAAWELAALGTAAQSELQRVFRQSQDPEVRAAAAAGLGECLDVSVVPELIEALNSSSVTLRTWAAASVEKILGASYGFDPQADPAGQRHLIEAMRHDYQMLQSAAGN